MGVPGYFKTLLKKNNKILDLSIGNIDYFLMDYNNIIHTAYQEYIKHNDLKNKTKVKIQKEIINYIVEKTLYIVNNIIKPKNVLYIAMDGVPPRAKMEQQRLRRYKKVFTEQLKSELKKKYNIENNMYFDSNQISPGTIFMDKLSKHLKKNKPRFNVKDVIISDTLEIGEGEHKILNYIKENIENKSNICIYGDDADLIFLMMSLELGNNVNIMKSQSLPEDMEYGYLNINKISKSFCKYMEIDESKKNKVLNDYIFLMMIFGDDFVKNIPSLNIRRSYNLLLDIYKKKYKMNGEYLTKKIKDKVYINNGFLIEIFEVLSKLEKRFLLRYQKNMTRKNKNDIEKKIDNLDDSYENEFNYLEHGYIFEEDHILYNEYKSDFERINYYSENWKRDYYEYFFENSNKNKILKENYNKFRSEICKEYMKSWKFAIQYYLCGVKDWKYYYGYRVAPFASDILTNLKYRKLDINNINFNSSNCPYCPLQQLLLIMPPQMKKSLPKICGKVMSNNKLKKYFPQSFKLDVVKGLKYIYSEPIFEEIDEEEIFKEMENNIQCLNGAEKDRLL